MPDDRSADGPAEVEPVWNYTRLAQQKANESPYGSTGGGPYGSYLNRHIIGRDSRILGGISVVAGHPICIIVSEEDWHLPAVYTELQTRLESKKVQRVHDLLAEVHALVREKLRYVNGLNKIIRQEKAVTGRPVKLPLAFYVSRGEGVCWQQGLLAAYLMEKLIDDGVIKGSTSTDRNMKLDTDRRWRDADDADDSSDYVGHQWARYTAPDGTIYIVDPAQNYCGRLNDVMNDPRPLWRDYFRPGEPRPAGVPDEPEPKVDPRAAPWVPPLDPLDLTLLATGLGWLALRLL